MLHRFDISSIFDVNVWHPIDPELIVSIIRPNDDDDDDDHFRSLVMNYSIHPMIQLP